MESCTKLQNLKEKYVTSEEEQKSLSLYLNVFYCASFYKNIDDISIFSTIFPTNNRHQIIPLDFFSPVLTCLYEFCDCLPPGRFRPPFLEMAKNEVIIQKKIKSRCHDSFALFE